MEFKKATYKYIKTVTLSIIDIAEEDDKSQTAFYGSEIELPQITVDAYLEALELYKAALEELEEAIKLATPKKEPKKSGIYVTGGIVSNGTISANNITYGTLSGSHPVSVNGKVIGWTTDAAIAPNTSKAVKWDSYPKVKDKPTTALDYPVGDDKILKSGDTYTATYNLTFAADGTANFEKAVKTYLPEETKSAKYPVFLYNTAKSQWWIKQAENMAWGVWDGIEPSAGPVSGDYAQSLAKPKKIFTSEGLFTSYGVKPPPSFVGSIYYAGTDKDHSPDCFVCVDKNKWVYIGLAMWNTDKKVPSLGKVFTDAELGAAYKFNSVAVENAGIGDTFYDATGLKYTGLTLYKFSPTKWKYAYPSGKGKEYFDAYAKPAEQEKDGWGEPSTVMGADVISPFTINEEILVKYIHPKKVENLHLYANEHCMIDSQTEYVYVKSDVKNIWYCCGYFPKDAYEKSPFVTPQQMFNAKLTPAAKEVLDKLSPGSRISFKGGLTYVKINQLTWSKFTYPNIPVSMKDTE